MIAVMQAYADGKKIEFLNMGEWIDCSHPSWNWVNCTYRIKPEPKYRPYENADECFADMEKHGSWIKEGNKYRLIVGVEEDGVVTVDYNLGIGLSPYLGLLREYVWADDGTPCGVLEEE